MHSPSDYLNITKELYANRGPYGVYKAGRSHLCELGLRQIQPLIDNESEYILDKEWDALLILDGCRVDALEEVAHEYSFLPEPPHDTIWSADSYSKGWLEKNFTGSQATKHQDKMDNLVYVSGNPFTEQVFTDDEFQELDEVWTYAWDNENGTVPPKPLTDRAITHHRQSNPDHLLVHYMQPHAPFISESFESNWELNRENFGGIEHSGTSRTPWELLRDRKITEDELWTAYIDTLRVVLNSVEKLLQNIDAETVVLSADHGNAMGEWGIYDHPAGMPIESVRSVPWVVTNAEDTNEYTPLTKEEIKTQYQKDEIDTTTEERLEHLGYK